ncbi:MAG: arginase family protein [Rhodothermales bacterium]
MIPSCRFFLFVFLLMPSVVMAQKYQDAAGTLNVALVINPYNGDRAGPEVDVDAEAMADGGLIDTLANRGVAVQRISKIALSEEEEKQYGRWNRFGMANGHLAAFAAANEKAGYFNIGLYNNCSSAPGMLGGLQQASAGGEPLKVALVWIDAHGDYNTPETTLSGMLGGMPLAVAAGHALTRLRKQAGLDPALPTEHIVMACVRDTDPLEQERIDDSLIEHISVADVRSLSDTIREQMERLSRITDLIYIHIDLDVLDPEEVAGHPLTVPDGPTSRELAAALEVMFRYEKAAALGIASYPADDDPDKTTLKAVHRLVVGAVKGLLGREHY